MHEIECILHEYLSFNWDRVEDIYDANAIYLSEDGLKCAWHSKHHLSVCSQIYHHGLFLWHQYCGLISRLMSCGRWCTCSGVARAVKRCNRHLASCATEHKALVASSSATTA